MTQTIESHFVGVRQWSARVWTLVSGTVLALVGVVPLGRTLAGDRGVERFEYGAVAEFQEVPHWLHVLASAVDLMLAPPVVAVAVCILLWCLQWRWSDWAQTMRGACVAGLPMIVVLVVKVLVDRPRPGAPFGVHAADPGFPSGHTAGAVCLVALVLVMLRLRDRQRITWSRVLLGVVSVVIPLGTAATRLVLGVHYPSDVLTSLVLCSLVAGSIAAVTK